MPPLVARQWQVVMGAPATIGTLFRPRRLFTPTVAAVWRSYARQAKPSKSVSRPIVPLNSAIIIPASVPDARPADLIHFIQPVLRKHISKETFCVFLVTPSFAPWLLNDAVFLEKALHQAYSKLWCGSNETEPPPFQIRALCAVVDKLPTGRAFRSAATIGDEVARRMVEPPVAEAGFEGIAYATLPATASVSSTAPVSSDKAAIDFIVNEHTADGNKNSDVLRVPLANTVFQTGTATTMTFSTWKARSTTERLELVTKSSISHHGVRIAGRDRAVDRTVSALSIPLVPLTVPRRVEGCMGNIIRRVTGPEGNALTASSELEEVVPRFFKSRGESAQATTAWALVIPGPMSETMSLRTKKLLATLQTNSEVNHEGNDLWERLWQDDPPAWNTLVPTALAEGARLHRVLSGGGGWGKKAGLLSLDPVPTSDHAHQQSPGEIPSMLEDPQDFASTLTPVVQDGDFVQFFVSPGLGAGAGGSEPNGLAEFLALPKQDIFGWEFGTIPSTVDSLPGGSWQHTNSTSNEVSVFKNTFGALAEGGLMLTQRILAKKGETASAMGATIVDVPFSRFWAVELSDKGGSNRD
ncbi:hypothetical protein BKA66DRAFT_67022 [Pyrenochaeta sp. MPI-SDFR-AT-0127]|nr:hypothetical protein BKA66DRAFT_67022 [Pyrenochaeta sp. MPI-SDFR-AT-0127]